jgi:peroxiredoxin
MGIKKAFIVLLAILIIGLVPVACSGSGSQSLQIDSPAPDFNLTDLNGQSVSLSSLKGKYILLNFWSTTCGPCVEEMPYFQSLHNDWSAGAESVVITVSLGESSGTVKNFMQENNYNFPVLLDSQYSAAEKYAVQYTPTSFFINREGQLKLRLVGAFKNKAAIEKQVAGFMEK